MTMTYQQPVGAGRRRSRFAQAYDGQKLEEQTESAGEYLALDARKKKFEDSQQLSENSRRLSEQDSDYYHHKQWSASEIAKLRLRGQVPIVINRIQRKIDTIVGIQERSAVDPQAAPRNPNDEQAGEVATDAVRFVCDANEFDGIKRGMFKDLCVYGTTGCEVCVHEKNGQMEVKLKKVRWETAFWDGRSREEDFNDAQHLGFATWMHRDDIEDMYGTEAGKVADDSLGGMGTGGMAFGPHDDRPTAGQWMDGRNKRILVVDMYCRYKGQWTRSVFCSGGDLIAPVISEYTDEFGEPTCPLEFVSVYVDRENARYGVVRGMIGPQDEINYRRSKFLHFMSTRQTYGNQASMDNVDKAKRELGKPHGHVELAGMAQYGKDFGIIETGDMAEAQQLLLQEAKSEIDLLGPNAGLTGRQPDTIMGAQSGKAWMAQQQAGLAELASLYAAYNDLLLRIYKQIWYRVRQYWDAPRYVRVSDNAQAYKFTMVNEPITDEAGNVVFQIGPDGQPVLGPDGQPLPQMKNRPAEIDVDISFENVPDTVNLAEEQFEKLTRLAEAGMPIPPQAIIAASNIRNKKEILDAINQQQQQPPQPDPAEMAKIQAQQQGQQAKLQADAQGKQQQLQAQSAIKSQELQGKAQIEQTKLLVEAAQKRREQALKEYEAQNKAYLQAAQAEKARADAAANLIKAHQTGRAAVIKAQQPPAGRGNGARKPNTSGY